MSERTSYQIRAELHAAKQREAKAMRMRGVRRRTVSGWIIIFFATCTAVLTEVATFAYLNGRWGFVVSFGFVAAASLALLVQASMDYGYRQCERDHNLL